jgi:hypothetical protein
MRLMITFTHIDGEWGRLGDEGRRALRDWHRAFRAQLRSEQGAEMVNFAPRDQARTVRLLADGQFRVDDGPFQHGVESAGGYFIVDVDSLDETVAWARRGRFMPGACEVRELVEAQM